MSDPHTPLATELFRRFSRLYGPQKLAGMWKAQNAKPEQTAQLMREVRAEWEVQLRRFDSKVLAQALQAVIDEGREWPPTLPEFVKVCKDFRRPELQTVQQALPAPSKGFTDNEKAKANLARIRQMMATAFRRVS